MAYMFLYSDASISHRKCPYMTGAPYCRFLASLIMTGVRFGDSYMHDKVQNSYLRVLLQTLDP